MRNALLLAGCIALTMITGGVSGYLTVNEIEGWYRALNKPSFNPPNYVFGPVWTLLYVLMGISLFLIVRSKPVNRKAVYIFFVQLVLNFSWSLVFFNLHNVMLALIDIVVLWIAIAATIVSFYRLNKAAGLLQVPYLLWVSFATALNCAILLLN